MGFNENASSIHCHLERERRKERSPCFNFLPRMKSDSETKLDSLFANKFTL